MDEGRLCNSLTKMVFFRIIFFLQYFRIQIILLDDNTVKKFKKQKSPCQVVSNKFVLVFCFSLVFFDAK